MAVVVRLDLSALMVEAATASPMRAVDPRMGATNVRSVGLSQTAVVNPEKSTTSKRTRRANFVAATLWAVVFGARKVDLDGRI